MSRRPHPYRPGAAPGAIPGQVRVLGVGALVLLALVGARSLQTQVDRFEYAEPHMGTMVRLVMYAPNPEVADRAAAGAFATFTRLDSLFSDYREDSEIGLLATEAGSGHPRSVSPELLEILEIAEQWRDQSGGAFSVTVGPMTRLWRWAIRRGELPEADRLDAARLQADPAGMEVLVRTGTASETRTVPRPGTGTATGTATGTRTGTVTLNVAGMSLDLGGIAKGYAAQKVVDQLAEQGLSQVLVDAGGDMVLGAAPPKQGGWRVEFPDGAVHHLANVAVATSGDRYQYLEVDGVRYSHILDPGTGLGMTDAPTVVVVAPNGAAADAAASALTVLAADPAATERFLRAFPELAVQILPRSRSNDVVGDQAAHATMRHPIVTPGFPQPRALPLLSVPQSPDLTRSNSSNSSGTPDPHATENQP